MGADPQRKEETHQPSEKRRLQISSLLPIVALGLSLLSLYVSEQARTDVARMEVIKTEYGLFHGLAQIQLQYPLMAHLFTVTNQAYDSNVERIRVSLASSSEQKRAEMLLQERAIAHYLFTTYEEAYYLWQQSKEGSDRRREELAHDDLEYFNIAICSNPRLLWYWDFNGGKLDAAFATELKDYYKENVLKHYDHEENVLKKCETEKDSAGPFGN